MNLNYDKELEKIKSEIDVNNPPRLLLQVCCAPCATYCLTRLLTHFDVTLYYCNDNITDSAEWQKRLDQVTKLVDTVNGNNFVVTAIRPLKLVIKEPDATRFFAVAKGKEREKEGGARCKECFVLRLTDSLNYAQENGFDYFGTTLTVSPYKNSQLLNEIGLNLQTNAVKWLMSDFKKQNGYQQSIQLSQQYDLYRQHYCGCCYSLSAAQD
ncbi:MAG: epoxyqueuosine reductase QueH [Clostridiales bacterium]|nr:epoxyqueuosine reductase QueH [Clostridiales bacterium]